MNKNKNKTKQTNKKKKRLCLPPRAKCELETVHVKWSNVLMMMNQRQVEEIRWDNDVFPWLCGPSFVTPPQFGAMIIDAFFIHVPRICWALNFNVSSSMHMFVKFETRLTCYLKWIIDLRVQLWHSLMLSHSVRTKEVTKVTKSIKQLMTHKPCLHKGNCLNRLCVSVVSLYYVN